MLRRSTQSTSYSILLSFLSFSQLTSAALSLQALQPIANFPAACQNAYQTPIQACPDANSFSLAGSNSGASICSKECYLALSKATASIQKACQGSSAPPGTVIAHAFSGDLPLWLCTLGSGSGTQPSSNYNPSSTVPSLTSVASTANPTSTVGNSAITTRGSTSTDLLSNSGAASATKTPNLGSLTSSVTSSQTTLTPSSNRPSEATSESATTPSSSSRSEQTLKPGGGGSPFDQVVPNAGVTHNNKQSMSSIAMALALVAILGF